MRCRSIAVVVAVALTVAALATAEPRPMTAVDLLSVPTQSDVQLAPGGNAVLFVRTQADWEQDKLVSHIWRVAADGSGLVQMTNGKAGESAPRWSPDGSRFCFIATRDGDTAQLFVQPAGGGEAIQVSRHETSVSRPEWLPDGSALLFLADDGETKEIREANKRSGDVVSFDRDYRQTHLWALDLATRSEKRLTEGSFSVGDYAISPDGAVLAYTSAPTSLVEDGHKAEIYVRPLAGGKAVRLTHDEVSEHGLAFARDGQSLLFEATCNERFEPYHQSHLFEVSVAGGAARIVLPDAAGDVHAAAWARDGRSIVALVNSGVRVHLWALKTPAATPSPLTSGDASVVAWDLDLASGAWAAVIRGASSPGDVWVAAAVGATPIRLTHFAEEVTSAFRMPRVEAVSWTGDDGQKVEGLVTYPLNWKPGTRAPLVVQTHGGPAASSTFEFPDWAYYAPVLAGLGYMVLDPNYRGSTGYGDAFLRDMVGHYFHQADKDVLAGVDALVAKGLADPDKLAAMGWSAGGHMTNWLVATTGRFKAAASGAGAADWISMYAQSDARSERAPWFGGTPWQKGAPLGLYLEQSPIRHLSAATTPTLLMVGEKDVRVPTAQSIEMFRALRSVGVETELLVFPGEPHGLRTLKHRLYKIDSEIAWFERHLFGRAYAMETPPAAADEGEVSGPQH
jgi:dipeptidyl aminopeptidase/acylaminoacyl peptidase